MKKIFYIFLLLSGVTLFSEAATRGDVKIIEASENIRYLSQKMVKEYLFLYHNPQRTEVQSRLDIALEKISDDFRIIATTTKDTDTKNVLDFLMYSKNEIEQMFDEKPDQHKSSMMLEYSETFLEGADSIAGAHMYDFSEEEKMLMVTKKMEYLLERMTKYYMAFGVGFNTANNKEIMEETIKNFEENLEKINLYAYPDELENVQANINEFWEKSRIFFKKPEELFIPHLMLASVGYIEDDIAKIALHHSKNQ